MELNARKRFETGEARALFEKPLKFLHIHVLREYLEVEFASIREILEQKHAYDFENIVDDFVFMVCVKNDNLPVNMRMNVSMFVFYYHICCGIVGEAVLHVGYESKIKISKSNTTHF